MQRVTFLRTVVAACGVAALLAAASCGSGDDTAATSTTETTEFSGYVRSPALQVGQVTLPAADGSQVAMAADPDHLRLVYFGYTYCPDVCPTTLAYVKKALAELPQADRDRIQLDMVTIDPSRDDGQKLTDYVTTFVPGATALRTDDAELLRSAANAFGADYSVTTGEDGKEEVSHTGDLYVVDDTGTVILAWPFGTTPGAIERDLRRLLDGDRPSSD